MIFQFKLLLAQESKKKNNFIISNHLNLNKKNLKRKFNIKIISIENVLDDQMN